MASGVTHVLTSARRPQRWRFALLAIRFGLAFAAILLVVAFQAHGDVTWAVQSGDWSVASNWGGSAPGYSDDAYIINGGTAAITLTGAICNNLYLGDPNSANSGTIQMSGGNLESYGSQFLGSNGDGAFIQSGGDNSDVGVTTGLYLGCDPLGSGYYNLSGTGVLSPKSEYIGYSGAGTFIQSGGTNNGGNFYLGYNTNSSGSYTLSGSGVLRATERVGYSGTGTFTQYGGTNNSTGSGVAGALCLGYNSGSSGSYTLTGSGVLSAGFNENVGLDGVGTFVQSGGSNSVTNGGSLYLGHDSGSSGSYTLTGSGVLSANEFVGYLGAGTFIQSGGTNNGSLNLGYDGSSGSYTLGGSGALSADHEYVGYSGAGTFAQSGGTNSIGSGGLYLGYNPGPGGSYTLSGSGLLAVSGTECVGRADVGTFTQSGGTNNIDGSLYLSYETISSGSYTLSGSGVLAVSGAEYVGRFGTGTFTQSGGTNTVTGSLWLGGAGTYDLTGGALIVPGIPSTGVFNLAGGTLAASAAFSTSQAVTLTGGNGNINTGVYQVTLSGILSGSGGLNLSGTGTLTLAGSDTYTGGTTISAGTLQIGNSGVTGSLAGNITCNAALVFDRSDNPTFGGSISGVGNLSQAGTGILTLTGSDAYSGSTTISSGTLRLGSVRALPVDTAAAVNGTLDLNTFDAIVSALTGTGTVNHSGTGSNSLTIGSGSFAGMIENTGGSIALLKIGSGQLILSGSDSYCGGTNVDAGTLYVTETSAIADGTRLTVGAGGTFIFDPTATFGSAVASSAVSQVNPVPEPGTLALLSAGAIGFVGYGWCRRASRRVAKPAAFAQQDAPAILSFPSHSTAARRAA